MEQKQKDALWAQYTKQTHRLGRVLSLITVALLLGAPFVIGALLGAYPDLGATARGFLSVGLVWTVSSVAEFLIYTPMLGAGGGYLAFITGNLINMKIPCAVNARDLAGVRTGTPENEIVSTLSIATSSLVTSSFWRSAYSRSCRCSRFCSRPRCSPRLPTSFRRCSARWRISITGKTSSWPLRRSW